MDNLAERGQEWCELACSTETFSSGLFQPDDKAGEGSNVRLGPMGKAVNTLSRFHFAQSDFSIKLALPYARSGIQARPAWIAAFRPASGTGAGPRLSIVSDSQDPSVTASVKSYALARL